jgi:hypothetical protein
MKKLQRLGIGLGLALACLSSGTAYAQSIYGIGGSLWATSAAMAGIKFSAGIQSNLNSINTAQPRSGSSRYNTLKPQTSSNRSNPIKRNLLDQPSG